MEKRAFPPAVAEPDLTLRLREIRLPTRSGGHDTKSAGEARA